MYKGTWVVVANSSKAKVYEAISNQEFKEGEQFFHPESTMKVSDLVTDRQGRSFNSKGTGRHAVGNVTDIHREEALKFAKTISEHIDTLDKNGTVKQLFLVANPQFLGLLFDSLSSSLQKKVSGKVNKDLTNATTSDLREYLPEVL